MIPSVLFIYTIKSMPFSAGAAVGNEAPDEVEAEGVAIQSMEEIRV